MTAEAWRTTRETMILLIAPFAPHLAEELWSDLGHATSVHRHRWPAVDNGVTEGEEEVTLVIQVDGRFRDRVTAKRGIDRDEALRLALERPIVRRRLDDRTLSDVVFVFDRLVNLITTSSSEPK
jgi:leucyl-tRNA synthetase